MRTTALAPVSDALLYALTNDAALIAMLTDGADGVHTGRVPSGALAPYVTFGVPSENASNFFGQAGTEGAEQVHVWAANPYLVRQIAGRILRLLGHEPLLIPGFDIVSRNVNLVTIVDDPDSTLSHGVIRFLPRLKEWPGDWPGVWNPTSATVLLAEASGQDGSQVVRSLIGPNGWLGDSPSTTTNDPTYGTNPDGWEFGETPDIGVSFGDVLLSVLNDPSGFTVAAAVEMPDFITGFPVSMSLVSKAAFPTENGLNFYVAAGRFSPGNTDQTNVVLQIKHNGTTGFTDYDRINGNTSAPIATPQVGQLEGGHVFGAHYDWSATRGARGSAWIDGVAIPGVDTVVGTDGPLVTTGPVRLAGPTGSSRNYKAGYLIAIARGVMPASWHEGLVEHAQARGWQ